MIFSGTFEPDSGVCVLDNQVDHYILVHPDTLVSGTTVSMATRCLRRSIFNERFRTEDQNEAMLMGTLLHDLFDVAMEMKGMQSGEKNQHVYSVDRALDLCTR